MQQIRINKTKEITMALNTLRKNKYPILSDSEIIKLLIGKEYAEVIEEPVEILSEEESREVEEAMAEIEAGKGKRFNSVAELIKELHSN